MLFANFYKVNQIIIKPRIKPQIFPATFARTVFHKASSANSSHMFFDVSISYIGYIEPPQEVRLIEPPGLWEIEGVGGNLLCQTSTLAALISCLFLYIQKD